MNAQLLVDIVLCLSALLGLSVGLLFWWFVLK